MKSLTCKYCSNHTHKETGATEKEVIDKMWEHVQTDHKSHADTFMALSKEDQNKMNEEARARIKDM